MKKILYINGNPQNTQASYSRRVGEYLLGKMENQEVQVEVFNVYEAFVPLIDEDVLGAWASLRAGNDFADLSANQQEKVERMNEILSQFKEADEYVFVTPLWNFSVTPMLKAYIDNVMIAGETFYYTENGPVGLMKDKKATVIQASGGFYSNSETTGMEHGSNYLETVLNFMGVTDISQVLIEGVAIPGQSDEERLDPVYAVVDELVA